MAPFDPELYLRLLGERGLLRGPDIRHRGYDAELFEAARALVATGAVDLAGATVIVDGYELASGLRNGRGLHRFHRSARPSAGASEEPRRTIFCNTTIERATREIRVGAITLTPSRSSIRIVITERTALGSRRPRRTPMRGGGMSVPTYTVTDDRGTKFTTSFSGGGGDHEWQGTLTTDQPVAVDTAWIELEGERIELVETPGPSTVTIEPVPLGDPAHRYLWHWLASLTRHGHQVALDSVLDALIASGSLDPGDPVLEVIREAHDSGRHMGSQPGPVAVPTLAGVPPEWRSLIGSRSNRRAASGTLEVAAVTPPFDGIRVTFDELTADANLWRLEVDISPGISTVPMRSSLDDLRIAWWAVDDRGQYHLGQLGSFNGNPDGLSGTVEFSPTLDRAATSLTLLPTGPTERARVEFPLDWSAP